MAPLSIGYQNALPTLWHVFVHSVLTFINLPEMIQLIVQSLHGDYYFSVGHTEIKTSAF